MIFLTDQQRFTEEEFQAANQEWGCNCGPSALACALAITLDDARRLLPDFEKRRYTSPAMMKDALVGRRWREITRRRNLPPAILPEPFPICGLVRVQWTGPWTAAGANPKWAYWHTHWIASFNLPPKEGGCYVFDCNGGMRTYGSWVDDIVPLITESIPRADGGWFATHLWEMN